MRRFFYAKKEDKRHLPNLVSRVEREEKDASLSQEKEDRQKVIEGVRSLQ